MPSRERQTPMPQSETPEWIVEQTSQSRQPTAHPAGSDSLQMPQYLLALPILDQQMTHQTHCLSTVESFLEQFVQVSSYSWKLDCRYRQDGYTFPHWLVTPKHSGLY